MPARKKNGQFAKKTHHRSGGKSRSTTTAIVVAPRAMPARRSSSPHHAPAHHAKKRRSHGGGGGIKLTHIAIAAGGLAYLAGDKSPVQAIPQNLAKLPSAKTLGNTTVAGLACLGVDRFIKRNKWLRLAGIVGVVAGALQVGAKGSDFQWVGDADGFDGEVGA